MNIIDIEQNQMEAPSVNNSDSNLHPTNQMLWMSLKIEAPMINDEWKLHWTGKSSALSPVDLK